MKPQVSGVVEALYVEAGDLVRKGENLARIKLIPNQLTINDARASVELARIRLDDAKRERKRQKEVYSKKLDIEQARAAFELAEQEERRQRSLFEDGVVSRQEYDRFRMDLDQSRAAYEQAFLLAENNLRQFENNVAIREAELEAAINNLQLLEEGVSAKSRQVANIIQSTVDGMVLDIPVEIGTSVIERNNFNEGTTIAVVADMNALVFEGQVDESDVGKLQEGMPLELTVGALEKEKFGATLEFISPQGVLEEGSVKFEIRASIEPRPEVFLRAGYSANADIILDRRASVVTIKERDVIFDDSLTFVEVQKGEGESERVRVELGLSNGIEVEVLSGVDTSTQIRVLQGE